MRRPRSRAGFATVSPRGLALAEALVVALLEASSYIGLKLAQDELSPLAMAALRNDIAFAALLPAFVLTAERGTTLPALRQPRVWGRLLAIGVVGYSASSLLTFVAVTSLTATTTGLVQNFKPLLALLLGLAVLRDRPAWLQGGGVALMLLGAYLFFPARPSPAEAAAIALLLFSFSLMIFCQVLGRALGLAGIGTFTVAALPFGLGGVALTSVLLAVEGVPEMSWRSVAIMAWLGIGSSAAGFTLLYHALRRLTNLELTSVTNLVPLMVAFMGAAVLGEALPGSKVLGLLVALAGVFVVQWHGPIRLALARAGWRPGRSSG